MRKLFSLFVLLLALPEAHTQNLFMSNRVGFFYTMKIFHIDPADTVTNKKWIIEYLETFDWINYNRKKNDEFERRSIIPDAVAAIRKGIDSVQFDSTEYVITADGSFGEYDFQRMGFNIARTSSACGYLKLNCIQYLYNSASSTRCRLALYNDCDINLMPMQEDSAKMFIDSRKFSNGFIDRSFFAEIHFRLLKEGIESGYAFLDARVAQGQIRSVTFWDTRNKTKKLGEVRLDSLPDVFPQWNIAGQWSSVSGVLLTFSAKNAQWGYVLNSSDTQRGTCFQVTLYGYINVSTGNEVFMTKPNELYIITPRGEKVVYHK